MLNIQRRSVPLALDTLNHLDPVIRRIYAGRGITDPAQIKRSAAELLPVSSMKGITEACELLLQVLEQQAHITIVGDFDADGATSTALMVLGLKKLGFARVDYKVPNRFDYGYGLSPQLAEEIVTTGTDMIITVDNGISC